MAGNIALSQQQQQQAQMQANMYARTQIVARATQMIQSVASTVIQPASQTVFNVPPTNVGLITGFWVKMSALITNPASGSSTLTLTANGPTNLLQNILFVDLQNYQRINTTGWHLSTINTIRQNRPFLSSTASDSPIGFGSNWNIIKAPSTIAANSTGTINMYYYVPIAYSSTDLTGAIWANVVNATMQLSMTVSTAAQAVVSNTSDPTLAIYQGAGAVAGVTLTNVNFTVYQMYYDQLPQGQQGPLLPFNDINTIYELKNTSLSAIVQGQDFNIAYSNFRHFLSTTVIFNNQLNGVYPTNGTDVNFFSLRSANYTDMRKMDPYSWQALTRQRIMTDTPSGMYYFDNRQQPLFTTQTGNMNLVLNPSLVNTNANLLVGFEDLANVNNLFGASSLANS